MATSSLTSCDSTYGDFFRGGRALITGGAGFIGSHLGRRLLELGAAVVVLDDLSTGKVENVPAGAELVRRSILDEGAMAEAVGGCDWVFHEAAMVSVPQSVEEPERCFAINVTGTQRVLESARQAGVKRVVFASSSAVYGGDPSLPSRESDTPDPVSPYAASKLASEHLLRAYGSCFDLSTVSLRYFNVFGPGQSDDSGYAAAIAAFQKALRGGQTPVIYGDGKQTRDFVPVENVVHANLLAASAAEDLRGEAFNVGLGKRVNLLEVLDSMASILRVEVEPRFAEERAGDVRDSEASIVRAGEVLGYAPILGFREGITRLLGRG